MLGRATQTLGTLLSGYVYRYDPSLPWYILSVALLVVGVLFILLVEEPSEAER